MFIGKNVCRLLRRDGTSSFSVCKSNIFFIPTAKYFIKPDKKEYSYYNFLTWNYLEEGCRLCARDGTYIAPREKRGVCVID